MWLRECILLDSDTILDGECQDIEGEIVTVIHRNDGPAVVYKDGRVRWVWADHNLSKDEWLKRVKENEESIDDMSLALLYLKYM